MELKSQNCQWSNSDHLINFDQKTYLNISICKNNSFIFHNYTPCKVHMNTHEVRKRQGEIKQIVTKDGRCFGCEFTCKGKDLLLVTPKQDINLHVQRIIRQKIPLLILMNLSWTIFAVINIQVNKKCLMT